MFLLGGENRDQYRKVYILSIDRTDYVTKYMLHLICDIKKTVIFQIRKITNCVLQDVGELLLDFRAGGCNTFTFDGVQTSMMCFSSWDRNDDDGDRDCQS